MDYRYLNSCLEGHEFPLPVIGDLLQGQAGNHLWTLPPDAPVGGVQALNRLFHPRRDI